MGSGGAKETLDVHSHLENPGILEQDIVIVSPTLGFLDKMRKGLKMYNLDSKGLRFGLKFEMKRDQ